MNFSAKEKYSDIPTEQKHKYLKAYHWCGHETPFINGGWAWVKTVNGVETTAGTDAAVFIEENTGTELCKYYGQP